jgi:putative SOS response-associated peptidase YedK
MDMCVNFRSAELAEIEHIMAEDIQDDLYAAREVWPLYEAPMIRRDRDTGKRLLELGCFGLLPIWAKDTKLGRSTNNARTETVTEKPSFRSAWRKSNFAVVPVQKYYEPNYESGKPVRWSIERSDVDVICVAAIWDWWRGNDKEPARSSFSFLTINADNHPTPSRFHGPEDEKRSLVHIPEDQLDAWLDATPEVARSFFGLPPNDLLRVAPAPTKGGDYVPLANR